MSSLRGFRCRQCRAEVLASGPATHTDWTPPILCCGAPLHPLSPDQILAEILVGVLAWGRVARCPRCGYRIRVVVHPSGPLVCRNCCTSLMIGAGESGMPDDIGVPAAKEFRGRCGNEG